MYAAGVRTQFVCEDHMNMIDTCDTCKNKDGTDESD